MPQRRVGTWRRRPTKRPDHRLSSTRTPAGTPRRRRGRSRSSCQRGPGQGFGLESDGDAGQLTSSVYAAGRSSGAGSEMSVMVAQQNA